MLSFLWEGAIEDEGKTPASEKKRRTLREKGSVSWSPIPGRGVAILWLVLTVPFARVFIFPSLGSLASYVFNVSGDISVLEPAMSLLGWTLFPLVLWLLFLPLMAITVSVIQVGAQWSFASFGEYFEEGNGIGSRFGGGFKVGNLLIILPAIVVTVLFVLFTILPQLKSGSSVTYFVSTGTGMGAVALSHQFLSIGIFLFFLTGMFGCIDYLLRLRRFEISIAMSEEEVKKERVEDSGRPEVRNALLSKAQQLVNNGSPEIVIIHPVLGGVLLGRPQGKGRPVVAGKFFAGEVANMVSDFRDRGIVVSYDGGVVIKLSKTQPGHPVSDDAVDEVVRLYQKYRIGR